MTLWDYANPTVLLSGEIVGSTTYYYTTHHYTIHNT